jgi:hypothetical protein
MEAYTQKDGGHFENSPDRQELRFYYSREERLKKLRGLTEPRKMGLFGKKRRRGLLIIFADIVLLAVVIYFINKPVNVFMKKQVGVFLYELNVTGIRGRKVLVAFTIKNTGNETMVIPGSREVIVKIYQGDKEQLVFQKSLEHDINLLTGESNSTIFILDEEKLPGSCRLELYFEDNLTPLFVKNVRF